MRWPWPRRARTVLRLAIPSAGSLYIEPWLSEPPVRTASGETRHERALPRCTLQVQAGDVIELTVQAKR